MTSGKLQATPTQPVADSNQPLRVALVSLEHPLGLEGGGIGTYVAQLAGLLLETGHKVEVFTGCAGKSETVDYRGYKVHRVSTAGERPFREAVAKPFADLHRVRPYDVVESAEFGADALFIKKMFPTLPLVVKLHTPSYLIHQLNEVKPTPVQKTRFYVGGLLRGQLAKPYWRAKPESQEERELFSLADRVCSPSRSLAALMGRVWGRENEIKVIANIFQPAQALLDLPVASITKSPVVGFFGKLEKRKGVLDLAGAIPLIWQRHSTARFWFVGSIHGSPRRGANMQEYIEAKTGGGDRLRFLGYQPYASVPGLLAGTQICVFPSLWENFPNVCLEAMAAGRAVVATNNGGMADMIEHNRSGILVPPGDPNAIAAAVNRLLANPTQVPEMGAAARRRVVSLYGIEAMGPVVEAFYREAIATQQVNAVAQQTSIGV